MAYPYMPAFQPYGSYLPQGYQTMMQPQQTPQAQGPTTSGIIWVSGAQEAGMYPVSPNNAVALWEQSGKTIYLKSADATGKPTMRVYDLVERTETSSAAPGTQPDGSTVYAKKDELDEVMGAIKGVMNDIEQIKGDLYGLSGKRKTVKKEVIDDDE